MDDVLTVKVLQSFHYSFRKLRSSSIPSNDHAKASFCQRADEITIQNQIEVRSEKKRGEKQGGRIHETSCLSSSLCTGEASRATRRNECCWDAPAS